MTASHVGGLLAPIPPLWLSSGPYLVVPFGRVLRVYNINHVPVLPMKFLTGHTSAIVSVVDIGENRVAAASKNGLIQIWDVSNALLIRTIDFGNQIRSMCATNDDVLICLSNGLHAVRLKKRRHATGGLLSGQKFLENNARVATAINRNVIAVINGCQLIISAEKEAGVLIVTHENPFTALTVSEDGTKLAVGDVNGKVYVYSNAKNLIPLNKKTVRVSHTDVTNFTLHWHSSPVRGLEFSPDCTLLLSGAAEATLVSWHLTNYQIGQREFLPRLQSSIMALSMSKNGATCALSQADNAVRLVDMGSKAVTSTIHGISASIAVDSTITSRFFSSRVSDKYKKCLQVTPNPVQEDQIILSGNMGHIQFYDVFRAEHIHSINVTSRNLVHQAGEKNIPDLAHVEALTIDKSGNYMATVDHQALTSRISNQLKITASIATLRFWDTSENHNPTPIAVFPHPHGTNNRISSVCFHPSAPIAVTTSPKGEFKIWRSVKNGNESLPWRVECTRSHKNHPCMSACFSEDSSVLAAAFGHLLTLWLVKVDCQQEYTESDNVSQVNVELLHALSHPPEEEVVQSVKFLKTEKRFVIASTFAGIYVWDVLTQSIYWSHRIATLPRTLIVDDYSARFSIACRVPSSLEYSGTPERISGKTQSGTEKEKTPNLREQGTRNKRHRDDKKIQISEDSKQRRSSLKDENRCESVAWSAVRRTSAATSHVIAIFDVHRESPRNVLRLPSPANVCSLAFTRKPGSQKRASHLVCVDNELGLSIYDVSGKSFGIPSPLETDAEHHSDLIPPTTREDSFLPISALNIDEDGKPGEDHRDNVMIGNPSDVQTTLSKYCNGPVMYQAPVHKISTALISELCSTTGTERNVSNAKTQSSVDLPEPETFKSSENKEIYGLSSDAKYRKCMEACSVIVKQHANDAVPVIGHHV